MIFKFQKNMSDFLSNSIKKDKNKYKNSFNKQPKRINKFKLKTLEFYN